MNITQDKQKLIGILTIIVMAAQGLNVANASERNNLSTTASNQVEVASQEALVLSTGEKLKKFENKGSLTDGELKELLYLVGFRGNDLKEAWAVAKKESNGQPIRFNGNTATGDSSYGMFQINMIGMLGPDRREKFDLVTNSDLLNPVINAQIAFHMSNGGKDWSAWKGMTPRTKEWMKKFPN
jgi:Lysozyme like domain